MVSGKKRRARTTRCNGDTPLRSMAMLDPSWSRVVAPVLRRRRRFLLHRPPPPPPHLCHQTVSSSSVPHKRGPHTQQRKPLRPVGCLALPLFVELSATCCQRRPQRLMMRRQHLSPGGTESLGILAPSLGPQCVAAGSTRSTHSTAHTMLLVSQPHIPQAMTEMALTCG
jgi:hypothetical protein